ncbi:TraB/TrbI/VirB10 family type IV secretion system protein [Sphingosinicella rhizophila]|uniref:TrbI/VirB10 family protein n=1 Tax=Sphingosinicella rhizophila TaxID=3050082 RepID=A0ABU3QAH0_9SPHN|nr:TrbI/VirB10 family protein [Sphingosinicella sp. GR2756]MDT9600397.1 TrbI/VirB10 family protein [Sphingosinicella sp. GR2756]
MTDARTPQPDLDETDLSEREIADELRLRPTLPPVMRLSRKVLIGLGAAASIGIGGVMMVALQGREEATEQSDLYNTDRVAQADGLGALPRDYSALPRDVPQLGPPLPGDMGRPMLSAQQRGEQVPPHPGAPGAPAAPPVDPAAQRASQEREAARTSALFSTTQTGGGSEAAGPPSPPPPAPAAPEASQLAGGRGEAFLSREADRRTMSADRVRAPVSRYVLQAGSIIPAALVTGLRSDLPGQVTAQVTSPVYDSPTGRHLLVPQGSRLIGQYDAEVGLGQERVLLVWNRLIFPDGRSIVLERQPGADAEGYAGLQDRVNHHWGRLLRAGLLSTLLGVGAELGSGSDGDIARAIREGAQDTFNQAGQQVVERELGVRPTITIRPGYPVRIIVTRDLVLEPSGDAR